jgi:hypothetical protein
VIEPNLTGPKAVCSLIRLIPYWYYRYRFQFRYYRYFQIHELVVEHDFPDPTFCAENLFESRSSPISLLIEEKTTISTIHHLLPVSFSWFHPSNPTFLITKRSSLRNGHPSFDLVHAFLQLWYSQIILLEFLGPFCKQS